MRRRAPSRYAPRHVRRRSRDKAAAQDRLGVVLIAVGVLTVVGVGIGFAATFKSTDVDKATGCPIGNQAPGAHTLILVDVTDKLDTTQIQRARSLIQTEYMWLPIGGQLTVRRIMADASTANDIVICRVDDGSKANSWTQNKKYEQQRFERTVGVRLRALYTDLERTPVQDASPILEAAAAAMDRPDFATNVEDRRLVIFSDFAQHSTLATHYGRRPELSERVQARLDREMEGVKVRLHYIERDSLGNLQSRAHRDFWKAHFRDMGANVALGANLLIGEDPNKETWIG